MTLGIVQTAVGGYLGTTGGTFSFGNGTGAGNTVIVAFFANEDSGNTVNTMTFGGTTMTWVASNWNANNTNEFGLIYYLPGVAGGESSITISAPCVGIYAIAWEADGYLYVDPNTSSGTVSNSQSTSWATDNTSATSYPNELLIGIALCTDTSGGVITGPASPWVNTSVSYQHMTAGYAIVSSTGTYNYSGTSSPADYFGAVIASFYQIPAISLADVAGSTDAEAPKAKSIAPALITPPPRPAGPPPPPLPVQVITTPGNTAFLSDEGAAADSASSPAAVPLADRGAAVDAVIAGVTPDQAAAADSIFVTTVATTLPDAGGAADVIVPGTGIFPADAAAGAESFIAYQAVLADAAGAAEVPAASVTAALADAAAAADRFGIEPAIGASGGATIPWAQPGTSQVAVAAPGSSTWYYLGTIGQVTALTYSFACPGGCDKMSCTVMVPASYRTQLFNPGWQVRITRGGHQVWDGKMDEPVPTTSGWNLTATGTGNLGTDYLAIYTDPWPGGEPDESVNNAITRGLPWVNPGIGTPSGAWFGQAVDPGAQTITALLNLVCTRGGLTWYVNSQPGGYPGDDLSVFPLPTTPNRLLVCPTPVPRTLGGDVNRIWLRYESSADSSGSSAATYGVTSVQNGPDAAAHQPLEAYIDLSDAGVMTAAAAQAVGTYVLSIYQRASFAGPFTGNYGMLMNAGGTPVDPGTDQAGTVCRLILTDYGYGGEVVPGPVEFIVGAYSWDDFAQAFSITPYQSLDQSITGLLQMENTILTPITVASS